MKLLGIELPTELNAAGRACREHLQLAGLMSALVNILYLAPTIYMMQVYDRVVATGGVITLLWLTVVIAFALATLSILDNVRTRTMVRAGLRLDRILAHDLLDRTMRRARQLRSGQVMRDFDTVRGTLSGPPALAFFDIPWTPVYILVATLLHPLLGGAIVVGAAVLLGITILNERASRHGMREAVRAMNTAYSEQERLLSQSELIRSQGMRRTLVTRQNAQRHRGLDEVTAHQFSSGRYTAIAKFARLFLQSAALGIGAWLAVERQISTGAIIAASVLMGRALQPIEALVGAWKPMIDAREALGNLAAVYTDTKDDDAAAFALPTPAGRISARGISFWADRNAPPLLSNVGIAAEPGELIGVTGPSGAGKSTLLRILAGALPAASGEVRIDGSEIGDWDPEILAGHIGYLPQDCGLLPGTIAENIARFANAHDPDNAEVSQRVLAATADAGAHAMITSLPDGYNHRVGWNGEGLSVGQRQRVALARAFYGEPPILIFDEPNAALDAEGEQALLTAIARARARGATVIVAAHRAAVLNGATRILVLVGGRVQHWGSPEEVRARLAGKPAEARIASAAASAGAGAAASSGTSSGASSAASADAPPAAAANTNAGGRA